MSRRPLCPSPNMWLALALSVLGASVATAQTPPPDHVWTATATGNWSTAGNWSPATVPTSNTGTVLQFNASGSTSYTANQDSGVADPFALQGIIFNSSSSGTITLAETNVGAMGLSFSTSTPFINQNNSGAAVINNNIVISNASSGSDLAFGGYGTGTVTLNGVISGAGGIQFSGPAPTTINFANGGNTFNAGNPNGLTSPYALWNTFATMESTATSGTPFGQGPNFQLTTGTVAVIPATVSSTTQVSISLPATVALFATGTIALNKGGNQGLTFSVNGFTTTLSGNSSGGMVIQPASGIATLGTLDGSGNPLGEVFTVTGTAPLVVSGIVQPTIIGQTSATDSTGDFLTYGAPGSFSGFSLNQSYTAESGTFSAGSATEIANVTTATSVTAPATVGALRVGGSGSPTTLTIASGQTLNIAGLIFSGTRQQAGLILNNSTIAGPGTLSVGGATAIQNELDIYASGTASTTGMSVISAIVTNTNTGGTVPALVKFGPGIVEFTNTANNFAAGGVITLYGGTLAIPGPGGTAQSTVFGASRGFVMRGGAFGIVGGDYNDTGTYSFTIVAGGGGFFVDAGHTLTFSASADLSAGSGNFATTGNGLIYKTGPGTLALTFPYNFGGNGIQVTAGTLQANALISGVGTSGPGAGLGLPTWVGSGATLAGTGGVPGLAIINAGATIAPGVSTTISALTVGGAVFEPTGTYQFKFNPSVTSPVAGTSNDTLSSGSGALDLTNLSSTSKFNVNLVVDPVGTGFSGSTTSYTAGNFSSISLPIGFSGGTNLTSLFNFTGLPATVTPTASEVGNSLVFTLTPANFWTWATSPVSGLWSNASNWVPATTPLSGLNTQLTFGSTSNATMTDDIAGAFMLNALIFNAGSPAYSLAASSGNSLNFVTNSSGVLPAITSASTNTIAISAPLTLTNNLTVTSKANVTLSGAISGAGSLTYNGPFSSTLALSTGNSYSGGTNVLSGTVSVPSDSALGTGNVTGASLGTLAFTGSTSTTKSFAMGGGTITVASGQTVTFNGSLVSNAFLDGAGTFATNATNGATFVDVTSEPSVSITSNSAKDQYVRFTNSANLTFAGGLNPTVSLAVSNLNSFTNEGLGSVTIGAGSAINAANFQTYGTLTLVPNTTAAPTVFTNTGNSPLGFDAGSRTFIGTSATADPTGQNIVDYVDLHGQNAIVAGGLFVNNGGVFDTSMAGTATIIADYGALVKGAGFYQNTVKTQNGGKFQTGNSPGSATFGTFIFSGPAGNTGVSNYLWQIDDPGPSAMFPSAPGVAGGTSAQAGSTDFGWSINKAVHAGPSPGNFQFNATTTDKLTVVLQTLTGATTVGNDILGPMQNFDPNNLPFYSWPLVSWAGTYTGPTTDAALDADTIFDTSSGPFANSIPAGATFTWHLDMVNKQLDLVYTPIPEPGTLALTGLAGLAAGWVARRRRAKTAAAAQTAA